MFRSLNRAYRGIVAHAGDLCILWPGLAHVSPWTLRIESLRRSITSIEMVSLPEFYALKRSEIHFSFR